jgi:nitroimidazol reductase NimA-like FMN-containing flavoprotein (pyridoxamine 5'-phosphate oxidase superfamily)
MTDQFTFYIIAMRRKDKEITDKSIIQDILSKSEICRIALLDGDLPYIVPLNYGFYENALYFHSARVGRKIDLIRKNNRVCFEIEYAQEIIKDAQACNWTARYRSVIGYGKIEILTDPGQKKNGLDIIMAHYGKTSGNQYIEENMERMVILKLTIDEISGKQSGEW